MKMNLDTDTQYAFTRPVADHMFRNYDGVLKVDGEVGDKKTYDPRTWGKLAEAGMAERVVEACENLRSTGTSLGVRGGVDLRDRGVQRGVELLVGLLGGQALGQRAGEARDHAVVARTRISSASSRV